MTKRKLLTFLGLCFFSCNLNSQVDKSELKQIFKEIISADSIETKYFLIDSILSFETKSIKQSGITYFIAKSDIINNGIWSAGLFDSARIISRHYLDSISESDPFRIAPVHYEFSLPYFSKDKKSFIVYYSYHCGMLCAEYSLRLYRKINGKWRFIKTYFSEVS